MPTRQSRVYGVEVCPVRIGSRAVFVHALTEGLTAQEHEPEGKGADEIRQLYKWSVSTGGIVSMSKRSEPQRRPPPGQRESRTAQARARSPPPERRSPSHPGRQRQEDRRGFLRPRRLSPTQADRAGGEEARTSRNCSGEAINDLFEKRGKARIA